MRLETAPQRYSYVRAFERARDRVDFSILAIEGERVVVRALISADPKQLDRFSRHAQLPRSRWVERGSAIGSHDDAAPPYTVDELYAQCGNILRQQPELAVRLYFHPNGLLMHCGFVPGECDDCGSVSIQSTSLYSVAQEPEWLEPSRWVCATNWGVFLPGAEDPLTSPDVDCWAAPLPEPAPAQPQDGQELQDICHIDPAACPKLDCRGDCRAAKWTMWKPSVCGAEAIPQRQPGFLDLGKPKPLDEWTFPFLTASSIECEGDGAYLRRYRPELPAH